LGSRRRPTPSWRLTRFRAEKFHVLSDIALLLAPIGYAGLALTANLAVRDRTPIWFWRAVVLVIVTHVLLVWGVRFEWQWSRATRNGYAGVVLFHGALAAILISVGVAEALRRRLLIAAFAVVTAGAVGAVFRYEDAARFREVVMVLAGVGTVALVHALSRPAVLRGGR
jgi:Kef-type K+ transport system membrane component KefB